MLTEGHSAGAFTDTEPVEIVPAPAAHVTRRVMLLRIINRDSAATTPKLRVQDVTRSGQPDEYRDVVPDQLEIGVDEWVEVREPRELSADERIVGELAAAITSSDPGDAPEFYASWLDRS